MHCVDIQLNYKNKRRTSLEISTSHPGERASLIAGNTCLLPNLRVDLSDFQSVMNLILL